MAIMILIKKLTFIITFNYFSYFDYCKIEFLLFLKKINIYKLFSTQTKAHIIINKLVYAFVDKFEHFNKINKKYTVQMKGANEIY